MKITETQSAENKGQYHSGSTDHDEHDDDIYNNNNKGSITGSTDDDKKDHYQTGSVSAEDDVNDNFLLSC